MLQITSNLRNYETLIIPANVDYVLYIMSNIANFKILQEINVQIWLKENVFGKL